MLRFARLGVALFLLLFCHLPLQAQESLSAEQLQRLKMATVFIKVSAGEEGATGSGFLIRVSGTSGYVITNHHVVKQALEPLRVLNAPATRPGSKLEVVFDSGTPNDRSLVAKILSVDPDRDLAVLQVTSRAPFPLPLDLQNVPKLRETLPVFICGFPFGDSLSQAKNPEITISPATVSAIRFTSTGQLREVQLTGSLNSGNSGGPVVTADGKLIGVARATIRGSGIGLAIPQQEVDTMLRGRIGGIRLIRSPDSPEFQLQAPLIDPFSQLEGATLHLTEAQGKLPVSPPDAPATLKPGAMAIPMRLASGIAYASVKPLADEGASYRVQIELKTKSGTTLTHPVDVSTRTGGIMGQNPSSDLNPPTPGLPGELPTWLKELFEENLIRPETTESLPPTAAGTLNLSDVNKNPGEYVNKQLQVNALTSGGLSERPDGYELDTHAGGGRPPSNLRIILPKDLACQLNDLGLVPEETFAIRLLGRLSKPGSLGEIRHTLAVEELQLLDPATATAKLNFRPEQNPTASKPTLGLINRFPERYLGQSFTFSVIFRGVSTFRTQPEVDLANGQNAKPLNLEIYTSRDLATQAEDELPNGSQLARAVLKVERVNGKTGKGVVGVTKLELISVRDGRILRTLTAEQPVQYPPESTIVRGPAGKAPRPSTPSQATQPAKSTPQEAAAQISWLVLAIIFGVGLLIVLILVGVGVYFLIIRPKLSSGPPAHGTPNKASNRHRNPAPPREDVPDEFPGFG